MLQCRYLSLPLSSDELRPTSTYLPLCIILLSTFYPALLCKQFKFYEMCQLQTITESVDTSDHGMNHTEGSWPKDVNPNDIEQTSRFRKKIERDEAYLATVKGLSMVSHLLRFVCTLS